MTQQTKANQQSKGIMDTLRNGVMALALAATLAAGGLGFAAHAEARVPDGDPRIDSLAAFCGSLQDNADALRAEYKSLGDTNPTSPRMDEILSELRQIWLTWADACSGSFGDIGFLEPAPQSGSGQATVGGTESQPPSNVSGPKVGKANINPVFSSR